MIYAKISYELILQKKFTESIIITYMTELDWTLTQMTFLLTNQNAAPVISCQQVWLQVVNEKQEKECQKDIIQNITIKPFISQEFMMLAFKLVRDFFIKLFRDWGCHSLISEFEIQHFYFKGNSGWEPPHFFFFKIEYKVYLDERLSLKQHTCLPT